MPPAYNGKLALTKLKHCPFCKSSFPTSNSNPKETDINWKYHVIDGLTESHVEAGEPNNARTKTLMTDSESCNATREPRTTCQCS